MIKIFEQIFREASKSRFINKIEGLSDEDKQKYISFFDNHPQYDNEIDWNNKNISKSELEAVYRKFLQKSKDKYNNTEIFRKNSNNPRNMFLSHKDDLEIVYENNDWFFVWVKTYKGAKFCDSAECGGQKAKWCIGWERSTLYWDTYTEANASYQDYLDSFDSYDDDEEENWEEDDENENNYDNEEDFLYKHNNIFVMAYRKGKAENNDLKFMLQINMVLPHRGEAWKQLDHEDDTIDISEWENFFNLPKVLYTFGDIKESEKIVYDTIRGGIVLNNVYKEFNNQRTLFNGKIIFNFISKKTNVIFNDDFIIDNQWKRITSTAFRNCTFNKNIIITKNSKCFIEPSTFNTSIFNDNSNIIFETLKTVSYGIVGQNVIIAGDLEKLDDIDNSSSSVFSLSRIKNKLVLPDSIKYIGKNTFYGSGIGYLKIPDGISTIKESTFRNADIGTLILPDSVSKIESYAFHNARIDNIILPKNLKIIESGAFRYAKIGNNLIIPNSVTYISDDAFDGIKVSGEFKIPENFN